MTGVLALQGDFSAHLRILDELSAPAMEVRTCSDLETCERLIIPGGESTTLNILLEASGLDSEIIRRANSGLPIWGTCMGMILLASHIENSPTQRSLRLLDITVRRNAFGSQVWSFEAALRMNAFDEPVTGLFIRAPIVTAWGPDVEPLGELEGKTVAVRAGAIMGTSFHPELTGDHRLHDWFLGF
jgi:5'-phosphate synthase pdxT subunit